MSVQALRQLLAAHGVKPSFNPRRVRGFSREALAGRLVELSGDRDGARLTFAFELVRNAQAQTELCAWVTCRESSFYPPDAAASGIRLETLVIIRVPNPRGAGRAADHLARSGAFGLIVVDLASCAQNKRRAMVTLPMPLQSRLLGLAQKHEAAIVMLTHKGPETPSLSSLVSFRAHTSRSGSRGAQREDHRHVCALKSLKDKHRAAGWSQLEVFRGPAGLP